MSGNVVVAVRIRPLANRELQISSERVARVDSSQTVLQSPVSAAKNGRHPNNEAPKIFNFDYSYDSSKEESTANYAGQAKIFSDLGVDLLSKAFLGYNCCIFAYGQTGSGKSYTMMGHPEDKGLIPRICENLFMRIAEDKNNGISYTVEVSYLEIYSEKVRDLLNPRNKASLRVREHPTTGPYVADLSKLAASDYPDIERLMEEGNKTRTVASTNMNESSSRSHAVFSIILTQKRMLQGIPTEKVSKISLVDLAGSERAESTGATGLRLKEGAEINRSLSSLGRVISALAERQTNSRTKSVVPYRDSVLTWLLKDSLGGNSSTAMIATISPSIHHYEETLSTLRYAQSAKHIRNHAIVNEDVNMKLIRELREELASLRSKLDSTESPTHQSLNEQMITIVNADGTEQLVSKAEIADRIAQSDRLVHEMNMSWEEKLQNTLRIQREREALLTEYGIEISSDLIGLSTPKKLPHLVNLSEDPLLSELLVYNIKPGITVCGNPGNLSDNVQCDIKLSGPEILSQHCIFRNDPESVTIEPCLNAYVTINGIVCDTITKLRSGCRIELAREGAYLFRFQNPQETRHRAAHVVASPTSDPRHTDRQSSLLQTSHAKQSTYSHEESGTLQAEYSNHNKLRNPLAAQDSIDFSRSTRPSSIQGMPSPPSSLIADHTALSRKRISDSEQLVQMLNAAAIEAEARGVRKSTNPLERLAAAQYEAEQQFRHIPEAPRFIESDGTSASLKQIYLEKSYRRRKDLRDIALTRSMLKHTELLQKAQNVSRQLARQITFQYSLINCLIDPISPHEDDRVFDFLMANSGIFYGQANDSFLGQANLVVRVMDYDKNVLYFSSLKNLRRQIDKYEQVRTNKSLPLLQKFAPTYTLAGQASIVLPRSCIERSYTQTVDIYSPYTNVQCAILKFSIACSEHEGKLSFSLSALSIRGFSEKDISNVHMHAFFGNDTEKRLATQTINGFDDGAVIFDKTHVCQLSVLDLPDTMHLHVYGTISERYMLALQSWDDLQESDTEPLPSLSEVTSVPVSAKFHITEMNADGQYLPSEVLCASKEAADIFYLHQGLSRRISINLSHPSQDLFEVRQIEDIAISNVRMLSISGREGSERCAMDSIQLKLMSETGVSREGITTCLAQWDSSMHNTKALDRVTPLNKVVLITISITLRTSVHDTITITSDLALRIYGRDESLSYLSRLFSARTALEVTKIFDVPIRPGSVSNQGRLDKRRSMSMQNSSIVKFKPRSVSLIHGFRHMVRHQQNSMALQETKMNYNFDSLRDSPPQVSMSRDRQDTLVRSIVKYWQLRTQANQSEPDLLQRALNSMAAEETALPPVICATSIPQEKAYSGYLLFAVEMDMEMTRAYFVVSGKYLLRYPSSSSQSTLESVTDLRSAQIEVEGQDTLLFSIVAYGTRLTYRASSSEERESWFDALLSASIKG